MSDELSFEWDEQKRQQTIAKHGLDFEEVVAIFQTPGPTWKSLHDLEDRWVAIGVLNGVLIAVIYTIRNGDIRLVTARRARTNERKSYHAYHLDRGAGAQGSD